MLAFAAVQQRQQRQRRQEGRTRVAAPRHIRVGALGIGTPVQEPPRSRIIILPVADVQQPRARVHQPAQIAEAEVPRPVGLERIAPWRVPRRESDFGRCAHELPRRVRAVRQVIRPRVGLLPDQTHAIQVARGLASGDGFQDVAVGQHILSKPTMVRLLRRISKTICSMTPCKPNSSGGLERDC